MTPIEEYCAKRFVKDQLVWVRRIDDNGTEFKAIVRGVHAMEPFEDYILEMVKPLPENINWNWDFIVMSKACLDPREE